MYLPKHFQVDDPSVLASLIKDYPLATVIGIVEGRTEINHLPLMLSEDKNRLYGHVARSNPLLKIANENPPNITAVFHGPSAYVTPSWYPSKEETGKVVPTWNYAVVHAEGSLKLLDSPQWLHAHVSHMTNIHEPTYGSNWKVDDAPEDYVQMMLKAIVGIEIEVNTLIGKFKLSQNRPTEDYAAVFAQLQKSSDEVQQEMTQYMKPN